MTDKQTQRAISNLRLRHEDKIRTLCEDIAKNAGYVLADLDRGRVPQLRSLLSDALGVAERIAALEAAAEVIGYYEAEENDR
jgi:hypothetical protein